MNQVGLALLILLLVGIIGALIGWHPDILEFLAPRIYPE